ncbi:hypothetical protein [Mangrovimonas sp. TPBH4]|uniref:hypothetical protein n=1 Tax=Mangrovimonas sp. TPBH4 TaxID=1645914 RepID=UPI000AA68FC5|nr:hypothetical protein [Mangrovimonas sp. TPBH4]
MSGNVIIEGQSLTASGAGYCEGDNYASDCELKEDNTYIFCRNADDEIIQD